MSSKTLEQTLFELNSIPEHIGVYPAAVKAQNEEQSYEQRDGFKNGWNACIMEYGAKIDYVLDEAGEPWLDDEKLLAAAGKYTFMFDAQCKNDENSGWYVFLNDTWYYACGDGEDIPKDEIKNVAKWYRNYGEAGALYWVYLQRGHLPTIPFAKRQVEAVQSLEDAEIQERKDRVPWRITWLLRDIENKDAKSPVDIARDTLDVYNKYYGPCPLSWDEFRNLVEAKVKKQRRFSWIKSFLKCLRLKK
jgi:hypothetical protein